MVLGGGGVTIYIYICISARGKRLSLQRLDNGKGNEDGNNDVSFAFPFRVAMCDRLGAGEPHVLQL